MSCRTGGPCFARLGGLLETQGLKPVINELRHGLSVGVERAVDSVYMTMAVAGKLTHEDYQVINPMLENALIAVKRPEINELIDARAFEG